MFDRLQFWKEKGVSPSIIYDIGAHEGGWSREARRLFPEAQIYSFEANNEHLQALSDLSSNIVLLGATETNQVPFYKNMVGCTTGNSIYLEQTLYFTPGNAIVQMLPMVTLDQFVLEKHLPKPDFIKLDVQGAELDILKGSNMILPGVKYIVLETSLHKYNRDAPLIEDIILFMKEKEFEVIDFLEFHRINGYLTQVDIFFSHSSVSLRKENFYEGSLKFE